MSRKKEYGILSPLDLKYETRLIAFLDILGFSQLVLERKDDDVDFIINLIPDMLKTHRGNSLRNDLEVTHISDSVIISLKTNVTDQELNDLSHLCIFIGRLQFELAVNGYYMRGGVTVGDVLHDSTRNLIIGPAFIEAYLLEQKKCIYPRVILDNKIKQFYNMSSDQIVTTINSEFMHFYYQSDLVTSVGSEDQFDLMIEYVGLVLGRYKNGFKNTPLKYLSRLKTSLEQGIAFDKYKWLASYTLQTFQKEFETLDETSKKHLSDISLLIQEKAN